ncbi:hypothetical protein GGR52DRAFT_565380, partial [Hypoxylon sp. FL1284]
LAIWKNQNQNNTISNALISFCLLLFLYAVSMAKTAKYNADAGETFVLVFRLPAPKVCHPRECAKITPPAVTLDTYRDPRADIEHEGNLSCTVISIYRCLEFVDLI